MTLRHKFILSSAVAAIVASSAITSDAFAARHPVMNEETSQAGAVLFRVENIQPVKDSEGLTNKCSFIVTVFNRMDKEVKEAKMELSVTDSISQKYKVEKEQVVAVKDKKKIDNIIKKDIVLASILPHQQKSFSFEIDTDKCYLLLDNINYNVHSCVTNDEKVDDKYGQAQGVGSCAKSFNYINSKNPEYYSEFKDVPDSVLEKQVEEEKQSEVAKVNDKFNATIQDLQAISETLDRIK